MKQDREAKRIRKEAEAAEAAEAIALRDRIKQKIARRPPLWQKWGVTKTQGFKSWHKHATSATNKVRLNLTELREIENRLGEYY